MILAVARVMLLGLLRDRGALAMAFLLPPLIYVIFAAIFASAAGNDLRLKVAVLDEVGNPVTQRLAEALRTEPSLRASPRRPSSQADLEAMVRQGDADVGVVLRADPSLLGQSEAPILVIGDAARAMATPIVAGQVQRLFAEKLPDAAYRRTIGDIEQRFVTLSPEQRARIEAILGRIEEEASGGRAATDPQGAAERGALVARSNIGAEAATSAAVIYYAGAVAMLFLLYSAVQGAMTLIDERQSGIVERLMAGEGSAGVIVAGKFLFLVLQGVMQVGLIFAVAFFIYGVDVVARFADWLLVTLSGSAAAAGLGLVLCVLCRTRHQAQTSSTFLVLVLSAIGGSMVPRFLMPVWLQDASWVVPSAWAIEAYHALFWRNAPATQIWPMVASLTAVGLFAMVLAWLVLAREQRA